MSFGDSINHYHPFEMATKQNNKSFPRTLITWPQTNNILNTFQVAGTRTFQSFVQEIIPFNSTKPVARLIDKFLRLLLWHDVESGWLLRLNHVRNNISCGVEHRTIPWLLNKWMCPLDVIRIHNCHPTDHRPAHSHPFIHLFIHSWRQATPSRLVSSLFCCAIAASLLFMQAFLSRDTAFAKRMLCGYVVASL